MHIISVNATVIFGFNANFHLTAVYGFTDTGQVEMVWACTTPRRGGLCQENLGGRRTWTTESGKTEKKVDRRREVQHGGLAGRPDGCGE